MERKWKPRTYKEGDEEGIVKLTKLAFGWDDPQKWNWRYKENPAGMGKIMVADDGGEIVGHGALIPVMMKIGKEIVTAYVSGDSVTHPGYRRQGIFEVLDSKKRAEAERDGNYVAYRFPNKLAYPGAIKLGWSDVCRLKTFVKPLNLENALKSYFKNQFLQRFFAVIGNLIIHLLYRTKKPPIMAGLRVNRISSFDNRINELWRKVSNDHDIMVVRNKEYLNWKYFRMPDSDFVIYGAEKEEQIDGYIILKCTRQPQGFSMGHICELIAPLGEAKVIHCLISKAIEYFKEEKIDLIFYEMKAEKTYYKILRNCGFISSRRLDKRHFCVYNSHPAISRTYLEDPEHWFIQKGDSTFGDSVVG
jgi:GNAT superfamily N-acetyltransferase